MPVGYQNCLSNCHSLSPLPPSHSSASFGAHERILASLPIVLHLRLAPGLCRLLGICPQCVRDRLLCCRSHELCGCDLLEGGGCSGAYCRHCTCQEAGHLLHCHRVREALLHSKNDDNQLLQRCRLPRLLQQCRLDALRIRVVFLEHWVRGAHSKLASIFGLGQVQADLGGEGLQGLVVGACANTRHAQLGVKDIGGGGGGAVLQHQLSVSN
mmetsp:Transcript_7530/g.16337  ORF Transcript_7530/g.16337 Transcript_7530/m.16337 type:complete len:212 (-) Transcript_7530:1736-2371(-)